MYKLEFSKASKKFLVKHKSEPISKKISESLEKLSKNPYQNNLDTKRLVQSEENLHRLRIGKYRIVYQIFDEKLIIVCVNIGSRGEIYKN